MISSPLLYCSHYSKLFLTVNIIVDFIFIHHSGVECNGVSSTINNLGEYSINGIFTRIGFHNNPVPRLEVFQEWGTGNLVHEALNCVCLILERIIRSTILEEDGNGIHLLPYPSNNGCQDLGCRKFTSKCCVHSSVGHCRIVSISVRAISTPSEDRIYSRNSTQEVFLTYLPVAIVR